MKIETGGIYRTRDGRRVEIAGPTWDETYPYEDTSEEWYMDCGALYDGEPSDGDLVAVWSDTPTSIIAEMDELAKRHGLTITVYHDTAHELKMEFRK